MLYDESMPTYSESSDFMGGTYVIKFETENRATEFVRRYAACPIWPVVTQLPDKQKVFVLAIELKAQQHGDFSQQANTLVLHPEYVGAQSIRFHRDDTLLRLLDPLSFSTGSALDPPCGSDCSKCASFLAPCRGCPATQAFAA